MLVLVLRPGSSKGSSSSKTAPLPPSSDALCAVSRPPKSAAIPDEIASPAPQEVLDVLWGVQEGFLDVALQGVEVEHGGIDNYLERVLHLNAAARARLAQLYLQR